MKRRIISTICAAAVLFTIMPNVFAVSVANPLYASWAEAAEAAKEGTDYTFHDEWSTINTAEGLAYFASRINDGTWPVGVSTQLGRDIDLSGVVDDSQENSWIPIGDVKNPYGAYSTPVYFNGNGHTVKGLKISVDSADYAHKYQGMFGTVSNAVIKDLKLEDVDIAGGRGITVGGVSGQTFRQTVVKNCSVSGRIKGTANAGGIVGYSVGNVDGSSFSGTVTGTVNVGGIAGYCEYENILIENCVNYGTVAGQTNVGGIVGCTAYIVTGSENKGDVRGYSFVGGIVGLNGGYGSYAYTTYNYEKRISSCRNSGRISNESFEGVDITSDSITRAIGGIVGSSGGSVSDCHNSGSVVLKAYDDKTICGVGGIASYVGGTISGCSNTGNVINEGKGAGGIAGSADQLVQNSYNTGSVSALNTAGGITGSSYDSVENCYNTGAVSVSGNIAGGISGASYKYGTQSNQIANCYNSGIISGSSDVGEITGYKHNYAADVKNCYYLSEEKSGETFGADGVFADGTELFVKLNSAIKPDSKWRKWQKGKNLLAVFDEEEEEETSDLYSSWVDAGNDAAEDTDYKNEGDIYTIYTAKGLAWLSNTVNSGDDFKDKTVVLADDIDLSGVVDDAALNSMTSWNPIGSVERPFKGSFDGQGHKITGMKIKRGASYQGLFGYVHGGSIANYRNGIPSSEIKNFTLDDSRVFIYSENADDRFVNIAGVVGLISGNLVNVSTGKNVSVSGNGALKNNVGGVAGYVMFGEVRGCRNNATIAQGCYGYIGSVGGVMGGSAAYLMDGCSNGGNIMWHYKNGGSAGGIAGTLMSSSSAIDIHVINCYNEGAVTGSGAGGIVGYYSGDGVSVINCYNTGSVNTYNIAGGGIASYGSNVDIVNCYNRGTVTVMGGATGSPVIGAAVGKITGENNTVDYFYYIPRGDLQAVGSASDTDVVHADVFDGNNSVSDEKLYVTLNNNLATIGKNGLRIWEETDGVTRLSNELYVHTPEEDENGKTEDGLYVSWKSAAKDAAEGSDYTINDLEWKIYTAKGLAWLAQYTNSGEFDKKFPHVTLENDIDLSGVVDDIKLNEKNSWIPIGSSEHSFQGSFDGKGHTIKGLKISSEKQYLGLFGIVSLSAVVENVNITGSELHLAGAEDDGTGYVPGAYGGAIAGLNNAVIRNCTSDAVIDGSFIGGIAGYNNGTIENCKNAGALSGVTVIGGITGSNTSNGVIKVCENSGILSGDDSIGGICGENMGKLDGSVNKGAVDGYMYIGGIAGDNVNGKISNSQNNGKVVNVYTETSFMGASSGDFGNVGGILGHSSGGSIVKCENNADILSETAHNDTADETYAWNIGGIAGCAEETEIVSCVNSGTVKSAEDFAGGIAGTFNGAAILNCCNTGTVSANHGAGGITGAFFGSDIENSYNLGKVSVADKGAGGIFGSAMSNKKGVVKNCYNFGVVTGSHDAGEIAGISDKNYTYENCFYPSSSANKGIGDSAEEIETFDNEGMVGDTPLYIRLNHVAHENANYKTWSKGDVAPAVYGDAYFTWAEAGDAAKEGTDYTVYGNTYTVLTPQGLAWIANTVNGGNSLEGKTVLLGNDINLSGIIDDYVLNDDTSWNPIGNKDNQFKGTFDGQNYKISRLRITRDGTYSQGLFGYAGNGSVIRNIQLSSGFIHIVRTDNNTAAGYIGGIAGFTEGSVSGCSTDNETSVGGAGAVMGGIVGRVNNADITDCHNSAAVFYNPEDGVNPSTIGGVAGISSGSIINCDNTADLGHISVNHVGGICGIFTRGLNKLGNNESPISTILNCYNAGNVTGRQAGGIVYSMNGSGEGYGAKVLNSYNTGSVSGDSDAAGIAVSVSTGDIYNCFNSGAVSSNKYPDKTGGLVLKMSAASSMKDCYYLAGAAAGYAGGTVSANSVVDNIKLFDGDNRIVGEDIKLKDILNKNLFGSGRDDALTWTEKEDSVCFGDERADDITAEGIEIKNAPRTSYIEGQRFNPEGLVISVVYSNGATRDVAYNSSADDFTITSDKALEIGDNAVTIGYGGFSADIKVNVAEKNVTSISISSEPDKKEYLEGEDIDLKGLTVTASYDNGTSSVINGYDTAGYNSQKPGTQTVTVTYGDKQAEFNVVVRKKSITGISITSGPTQTSYIEGTALNSAGLIVEARYDNGAKEILTNYSLSGFDSSKVGKCTVTVSYMSFTDTFDTDIVAKSVTGITLDVSKAKTNYIEGQELDTAALVVYLMYDNGTKEVTDKYKTDGYDSSAKGVQTVTVSYEDYTATYEVKVVDKTLSSVSLASYPAKTTYIEGQELDLDGLLVIGLYDNGTGSVVEGYDVTGYDKNKIGKQTITVIYGGKTAEFEVEVVKKSLSYITVSGAKTEYIEDNELDVTGIVVTAVYDNGTSEQVDDYEISGYDKTRTGVQTVTISYGGKNTTYEVRVNQKTLTGIRVDTSEAKLNYIEGLPLDTEGLRVYAQYNNGTEERVDAYTVDGYTADSVGKQTVTVTYESVKAEYEVTVVDKSLASIEIQSYPSKTEYIEGEELDLGGLIVLASYDNNTSTTVRDYDVTGYDKNVTGEQTVTITYGGKTSQFTVNVTGKTLEYIFVSNEPLKTRYIEGEQLNTAGLVVCAGYDNGDMAEIKDYTLTGFDSTVLGRQSIIVTYEGMTARFEVNVIKKTMTGILLDKDDVKTSYHFGQPLSTEGLKVYALYDNNTAEEVNNYRVGGYDRFILGKQAVTIIYNGFVAWYDVTVSMRNLYSIEVFSCPDKVEYTEGEELDLDGLVVRANYDDNTSAEIEGYTVSGFDSSDPGKKTITIAFGDQTARFEVTVADQPLTNTVPKLDAKAAISGNKVDVTFTAENCGSGNIIASIYKQGSLVGLGYITYDPENPINSMEVPFTTTPDEVKVMMWKNISSLEPVCDSVDILNLGN